MGKQKGENPKDFFFFAAQNLFDSSTVIWALGAVRQDQGLHLEISASFGPSVIS